MRYIKLLVLTILLFFTERSYGQTFTQYGQARGYAWITGFGLFDSGLVLPIRPLVNWPYYGPKFRNYGSLQVNPTDTMLYYQISPGSWIKLLTSRDTGTGSYTAGPGILIQGSIISIDSDLVVTDYKLDTTFGFTGGTVTNVPSVGDNIVSTNVKDWIQKAFYPTQNPTASLTVTYGSTSASLQVELMAAGSDMSVTLNWTAGRQAQTQPISTIKVMGFSQTFTQPSAPGTVSGTQSYTTPRNTNATFRDTVTTTDNKRAIGTATITWLPKRYWGRCSGTSPTPSEIIAAAGGGSELSNTRSKSSFTITASGTNRIFYTYPATYGLLTSLKVGGFESLGSFTQTTLSFTNASGYTQNYYIYTSINTFSTNVTDIVTN